MIARVALLLSARARGAGVGVPVALVHESNSDRAKYERDQLDRQRQNDRRDAQSVRERRETRARGNVVRANLIIDAQDPDDSALERSRVELISPIIDPATSKPLAADQADLYIRIIARHRGACALAREPVVANGRVKLRDGQPVTKAFPDRRPVAVRCRRGIPPRDLSR